MANKRTFYGGTLGVDQTGGTTYVTIGALIDGIKGEAEADTVETALLSDGVCTYAKTLVKPGTRTFRIAYDPDDTNGTVACATMLLSMSPTAPQWQITHPTGSTGSGTVIHETFKGPVIKMSETLQRKEWYEVEVTIQVSETGKIGMGGL